MPKEGGPLYLKKSRFAWLLAVLLSFSLVAAACGDDEESASGDTDEEGTSTGGGGELSGEINGAGASSQAAAMEAWIAGFIEDNPDVTVTYEPIGSGGGREQFVAGGSDFGGTDAALDEEELQGAMERCGELIELPGYISPIAVIYNLPDVEDLQLSPDTLAQIYNQEITNWNDPAIAETNPDAELPDLDITTVNRSDESGTTENLMDYLAAVAPDAWPYEVSGNWPVEGGEAAQGTSGVVDAVGQGEGTIGYADASQAGDLGVALIEVGDEFVGPTPEPAAAIVEASEQTDAEGEFIFAYDLARDTEESGTYPIVLISYEMMCGTYEDAETAELVAAFYDYVISEEGQDAAAEAAGSAPLSDSLREQLQPAIDSISGG